MYLHEGFTQTFNLLSFVDISAGNLFKVVTGHPGSPGSALVCVCSGIDYISHLTLTLRK